VEVDICVVGSGAGGGPVAWALSQKGYKVVVLEKGPWLRTEAFRKDELAAVRRNHYTPDLSEESHLLETPDNGQWRAQNTYATGRSFWNGNMVGGSSNLMSGYFHRLKPIDFRLQSEFGDIAGANIVDWPITYSELEPYYTQIEYLAGVSGAIRSHKHQEPRSTPTFPYPPLAENIVSSWIDTAAGAAWNDSHTNTTGDPLDPRRDAECLFLFAFLWQLWLCHRRKEQFPRRLY
jgi:choline dehydrogenase-like flavoprotein